MISLRNLDPFGVELLDLDLAAPLDATLFAELRDLVLDHGLLVARGQTLSASGQCALGRRFGEIESLSLDAERDEPGVLVVSNLDDEGNVLEATHPRMQTLAINERWHTDSSFRETPASISLLAARVVPERGGDTFYASLHRGWDALPHERREALASLRAVHDYTAMGLPRVAHDIVRTHPVTGRRGLYLSEHAPTIEDWDDHEGRALIQDLINWCTRPSRVYQHAWSEGDVVLWDNRSMLHRTDGFDTAHARVMHHVRIAG